MTNPIYLWVASVMLFFVGASTFKTMDERTNRPLVFLGGHRETTFHLLAVVMMISGFAQIVWGFIHIPFLSVVGYWFLGLLLSIPVLAVLGTRVGIVWHNAATAILLPIASVALTVLMYFPVVSKSDDVVADELKVTTPDTTEASLAIKTAPYVLGFTLIGILILFFRSRGRTHRFQLCLHSMMAKKIFDDLSVRERNNTAKEAFAIFERGGVRSDPAKLYANLNDLRRYYFIGVALANKGHAPLEGESWIWVSNPLMAFALVEAEEKLARAHMTTKHSYDPGDLSSRPQSDEQV